MNENLANEIRKTIESIKDLKLQVGGLNNYLSTLEGMMRADYQKKVEDAYQRGYKACMSENDFDIPCTSCDAYQRGEEDGRNEAWEAARKVVLSPDEGGTSLQDLVAIFGDGSVQRIFRNYSASEAIAKLKAYEEKQKANEEIKVGDVVERYINGKFNSTGIFLGEDGNYWNCLFWTGAVFTTFAYPKNQFKKTGIHLGIDKIMEEMRNE